MPELESEAKLYLETCKKGPTLEVWVVFPPPKLKSGIRDMKELLEKVSREGKREFMAE